MPGILGNIGAPGEIRTPDLLVRSQALYPTELRAHLTKIIAGGLKPVGGEGEIARGLTPAGPFAPLRNRDRPRAGVSLLNRPNSLAIHAEI